MNNNKYSVNLNLDHESSIIITADANMQIIEYNIKLLAKIIDKINYKFSNCIKINSLHIKNTQSINEVYKDMVQKYFRLINEILPNLKKSNNILDILLHTKIKTILSSSIYLNDSIYNILNLFITTNYKELNDIVITYKENIEYVFNKIKDYKLIDFGYNIYNNEYEYDGNPIKKRKNYNDSIISESFIDDMFSDISKYYETKNTDEKLYLEETNKNESQAVFIINKQKEIYDKCITRISDINEEIKFANKLNNKKFTQNQYLNDKKILKKDSFLNEITPLNEDCTFFNNEKKVFNDIYYTFEELEKILNIKIINFSDLPQNVIKVAEASFSEVFKCKSQIYKIIPLNNEFTQKKDFYKECFIHKILSCEKGICPLINFYIVKGKYTKRYLKAWDNFGFEENERPDKHNLFGVIVSEDGGICLEKYKFKSVKQILFFVRQIIQILSNLEIKYKFEHRDLHWGNILIKKEKISIIDFTLSRLQYKKIIYNDLDLKDWLFSGDESVDEQFNVYKMMKKECENNWQNFNPKTNIFWLIYLINKMFTRIDNIKSKKFKNKLLNIVLKYDSCCKIRDSEFDNF